MERLPQSFANHRHPEQQARAQPRQARHPDGARACCSDIAMSYFNMDNPVVGGYTPEKVALRRAIALAYNSEEEVRAAAARPGDRGAGGR